MAGMLHSSMQISLHTECAGMVSCIMSSCAMNTVRHAQYALGMLEPHHRHPTPPPRAPPPQVVAILASGSSLPFELVAVKLELPELQVGGRRVG